MKYNVSGNKKGAKPSSKKVDGEYTEGQKHRPAGPRLAVQEVGEPLEDWHETNHARLLRGEISWKHLSDIEIARGMGVGITGDFRYVMAKYGPLPERLQQALVQETIRRAHIKATLIAFKGMRVVEEIIDDDFAENKDRLRAIDMVWNRAWGAPTQLVVTTDSKFDSILEAVTGVSSEEIEDPDLQRVNKALTMGKVDDNDIWDVEYEDVTDP